MQASSFDDPIKGTNLQEPQPSFLSKGLQFPAHVPPRKILHHGVSASGPQSWLSPTAWWSRWNMTSLAWAWYHCIPNHRKYVWAILGIILLTNHIKPSFGRTWKLGKTHINQTGNLIYIYIYIYKPNQTVYIYIDIEWSWCLVYRLFFSYEPSCWC